MKQNKYDGPAFFAGYSAMPRSMGGLAEVGEWPAFRALLPDLDGKRVLDLGCGFGWHCRYARAAGASTVLGVDLSENMLARARALTDAEFPGDAAIQYRRAAIEDLDLPEEGFDVAISSLALHYVERFDAACRAVHRALAPGGTLVLSVEHPVFTACPAQDWHCDEAGHHLHWPLDDYQEEGLRRSAWMGGDVVKYHRTVSTHVNALIGAGFRLTALLEPEPAADMLEQHPDWADERRRPMFLLIAAVRD